MRAWGSALLLAAATLAFVAAGASANPQRMTDGAGDVVGDGADITTVTVSNDSAGRISFRVLTPNRTTLLATENIQLYIDSDHNTATGTNGYEFRIYVFGGSQPPVGIDRWTGSGWSAAAAPSFSGSFSTGLTASVARAEVGVTTGRFAYAVLTIDGRTGQVADLAPNAALAQRWSYALSNPVTDADRDGLSGSADKCPTVPRGQFDSNRNGCPGPFPAIQARISYAYVLSGGSVRFTSLAVKAAPKGARIEFKAPGLTQRLTASGAASVPLPRFLNRSFRVGTQLSLLVTKPGRIGYVGKLEIVAAGGLRSAGRSCTQATGSLPVVACARANRGK